MGTFNGDWLRALADRFDELDERNRKLEVENMVLREERRLRHPDREKPLTDVEWWAAGCRTCEVPEGFHCRDAFNQPMPFPHQARLLAAKENERND